MRTEMNKPRFRQLRIEELDPDQTVVAQKIIAYAGGLGGPFNMMLRSPRVAELCFDLGDYLLTATPLPRAQVEMAILMRARYSNSAREWWAHSRMARDAGLSEVIIADLREGKRPSAMNEAEAAIYEYCAELLTADRVGDVAFGSAIRMFGERAVTELTALLGLYGMAALFLAVSEVGAPDGGNPLPPVTKPFA